MKLSISNIAWEEQDDKTMYRFLNGLGYAGLEIAPTRIFPEKPYEMLEKANNFSKNLFQEYGLVISSMQSIWYGISEKMFASEEERIFLLDYTKKAIDFAASISCNNLVFGNPRNRNMKNESQYELAKSFFIELGEYAYSKGTVLALEPNPTIYNTNFINYTKDAFEFVDEIKSEGFKVNVDFGTILANEETLTIIQDNIAKINHVHISEPKLCKIVERDLHIELINILKSKNYNKFISVEMAKQKIDDTKSTLEYLKRITD